MRTINLEREWIGRDGNTVLEALRAFTTQKQLPDEHELARYASSLVFDMHDSPLNLALERMNLASAKFAAHFLPVTVEFLLSEAWTPASS